MTIGFGLLTIIAAPLLLGAVAVPSMLVSGEWLAKHLRDESLVILHVGSQTDFNAGHIPGARLVTLADISITDARGLRLELPPVAALEDALGRLGISEHSRIVVYAGTESVQSATRVWFTLDYLGLGDRAALLDGGLASWRAEGRPLSTEAAKVQPRKLTAHPAPQLVVDAGWVRAHSDDARVALVDARLPEFYTGTDAGAMPRGGHIPGSRNVPYISLFGAGGKLNTPEALRQALYGGAGEAPALTVSYCHIGQQATVLYFAARYLGNEARLYDGSFQDWSSRFELPIEPAGAGQALVSKIDALFASLIDASGPGGAVLVRKQGRTIFQRGYGVRDLRTAARIGAQTNFRLASVTKQFTAIAAMLLVKDGKLRYDTRLTDIFPSFPAYGNTITIRHLLTHTSGLPDYEDLMDAAEKIKGPVWSDAHQIQDGEVLDLLERQTTPKFAAGTSWSYSNSGYVILGLIVSKISGQPFSRFLHDRIFAPLQMSGTMVYEKRGNEPAERAYGYAETPSGPVLRDQSATSATQGDGGVYSNLADLAKWDEALDKNSLLSKREMAPALRPATVADGARPMWPLTPGDDNLAPGKPVSYGFGWFLDPYRGHARMWHFGSTAGFRTAIERFTDDQLTVAVICNRTDLDAGNLALQVADLFLDSR